MKKAGKSASFSQDFKRTLIYIPIIHTQADMGNLGESVRRETLMKLGKQSLKRKLDLINNVWAEIEKVIDRLELPYETVRLYQDGLPVCGREIEIVTELAKSGSLNHQLLIRLMERGAKLMGTESSEFLLEEYGLIKEMVSAGAVFEKGPTRARRKAVADAVLGKRDQYVADCINKTLQSGETGILFLGALHSLKNRLDTDIRVIYPVNRPLAHRGK